MILVRNPLEQTKPYNIPNRLIYKAYKRVKTKTLGAMESGMCIKLNDKNRMKREFYVL